MMDAAFRPMKTEAMAFEGISEIKKMPEEQNRDIDFPELRKRVVALQQSAANLAQLDLNTLAKLLPPNMAPQQVFHIKNKLLQLNSLQHRKAERSLSVNDAPEISENRCSSRYKTELCRPFEENGSCKYGIRCQFAHGVDELRTMTRHPKYKSQLCRTFHSNGLCPYGHRCHFIHNKEELLNQAAPVDLNNNFVGSSTLNSPMDLGSRRSSVGSLMNNQQMNGMNRQSLLRSSSIDVCGLAPQRSSSMSVYPQSIQGHSPVLDSKRSQLWSTLNSMKAAQSKDIPTIQRPQFYSLACSVSSSDGLSPPNSPIPSILEDPFSPFGNNKNNVHFFGGSTNMLDYNLRVPSATESEGSSPTSMTASPIDKFYMPKPFKMEMWKN